MRNFGLIFLLVLFGFPALEVYSLFVAADYIGWWLLLWLVLSALLGRILLQEESMAVIGRVAMAVQNGNSPFAALWDSGRTMLAAVLLIFPGIVSDIIAVVLLLLPNKADKARKRTVEEEGVIEGEVIVVDSERIESKSKST